MFRAYKTELNPSSEQALKINQTLGVCRFVYNLYLAHNKEIHDADGKFVSGMDFSKWMNNDFIPNNPSYSWIKDVGSKAVKQSIMNGEKAFKRFFYEQSGFPKFKKKGKSDVKAYFPKNNSTDWTVERHRIKVPTLGFVRLKEFGYVPTNAIVKSGTILKQAGRYYVSVLVEVPGTVKPVLENVGVGIDLGIKDFAVISTGKIYKNINKTVAVRKLEKQLRRSQRSLSRKYENAKNQNQYKGEATRQNIQKQQLKVQKLHLRIASIRKDHVNKSVSEIVKTKPSYVAIEDLNVKGMMKNRHLSKAVAAQNFYLFRSALQRKCNQSGIELRIVSRWYPSSKTCHNCGCIKSDLKLSDRIYRCDCGHVVDRDYNASLNLRDAVIYKTA